MTTHAKLSPSSSKRWMTCPGSIALIEELGIEDTTNEYAAEGTAAHEIHERCLLKHQLAEYYLGEVIEADGFKFTVNQNMVDAVQESLDYIANRIEEAIDFGYNVEISVEERSSLKYLNIPGLDGGTADVILLFWLDSKLMEVEIIDYKHGQGVAVEVIGNTQALCYTLGIIMLPKLNGHGIPEGIKITISQPRSHHPEGRIRSWGIDKDYLLNWEDDVLVPKANATHEKDVPLVPSDEGCRFCPANGQCSALYDKTQEIAIADFKDDNFPNPKIMTAEQKQVVMDHAVMIRAFIVAVENQIKLEVDHGSKDYENHYKLVQKTTHRKFKEDALDPDFSPLLDYLKHKDLFVEKPRSLGEIEKALKKEYSAKKAVEIMGEVTIKPKGQLVIAPISDKRKAAQPSAISDFKDLDD